MSHLPPPTRQSQRTPETEDDLAPLAFQSQSPRIINNYHGPVYNFHGPTATISGDSHRSDYPAPPTIRMRPPPKRGDAGEGYSYVVDFGTTEKQESESNSKGAHSSRAKATPLRPAKKEFVTSTHSKPNDASQGDNRHPTSSDAHKPIYIPPPSCPSGVSTTVTHNRLSQRSYSSTDPLGGLKQVIASSTLEHAQPDIEPSPSFVLYYNWIKKGLRNPGPIEEPVYRSSQSAHTI
ncbi:hypothetical protein C0995_006786 [Termitomyces sp. Mi166|nr:hypothetical protein C0995_006786 [Termitomyces sp. Mi166\